MVVLEEHRGTFPDKGRCSGLKGYILGVVWSPNLVKTPHKVTAVDQLAMHAAILKGDSVFYIFSV